jgi:hypothetical protein
MIKLIMANCLLCKTDAPFYLAQAGAGGDALLLLFPAQPAVRHQRRHLRLPNHGRLRRRHDHHVGRHHRDDIHHVDLRRAQHQPRPQLHAQDGRDAVRQNQQLDPDIPVASDPCPSLRHPGRVAVVLGGALLFRQQGRHQLPLVCPRHRHLSHTHRPAPDSIGGLRHLRLLRAVADQTPDRRLLGRAQLGPRGSGRLQGVPVGQTQKGSAGQKERDSIVARTY